MWVRDLKMKDLKSRLSNSTIMNFGATKFPPR